MKELQRQDMSPVKVIVENDPLLVILMKSDMAKAMPEVALSMVRTLARSSGDPRPYRGPVAILDPNVAQWRPFQPTTSN